VLEKEECIRWIAIWKRVNKHTNIGRRNQFCPLVWKAMFRRIKQKREWMVYERINNTNCCEWLLGWVCWTLKLRSEISRYDHTLLSSKCQHHVFLKLFQSIWCNVSLYLVAILCILNYMLKKSFKCNWLYMHASTLLWTCYKCIMILDKKWLKRKKWNYCMKEWYILKCFLGHVQWYWS